MTRFGYTLMSEQSDPRALVRPDDVAAAIPCGPDLEAIADAVDDWVSAGFTDVALVQIGDAEQEDFLKMADGELLPLLRSRFG